jgi:hypothetical protein
MTDLPGRPTKSEIILYQAEDGKTRVEVRIQGETVWLPLNQMAELFQRDKSVISKHIRNIFDEGELDRRSTVANFATVQKEGTREIERNIEYYNLDVIISVGYRVKSHRGTQFRIWATQRLREYIIKGFSLDDERFKQAGGSQVDPHGSFALIHVAVVKADPPVETGCDDVGDRNGEPHGVEAHFLGFYQG